MSAIYGLPPEQMTPVQRAEEITAILVRAMLRSRAASGPNTSSKEGFPLGFSAPQRGNGNSSQPKNRNLR